MKLAAFEPRFLLESVEGGERLARYSFIRFGDGLEGQRAHDGPPLGRGGPPPPPKGGRAAASVARCPETSTATSARHSRRAIGRWPRRLFVIRRGAILRTAA